MLNEEKNLGEIMDHKVAVAVVEDLAEQLRLQKSVSDLLRSKVQFLLDELILIENGITEQNKGEPIYMSPDETVVERIVSIIEKCGSINDLSKLKMFPMENSMEDEKRHQ